MATEYPFETNVKPHLEKITEYVGMGYSANKIAALIGVPIRLYEAMSQTFPEMHDAIELGRRILLGELEHSMFERAHGKYVEEKKVVEEKEHGTVSTTTTTSTKFIYSDKLMITALKRLDPRAYGSLTLDNMTPEEKVDALVAAVKSLPDDLLQNFYEGIRTGLYNEEGGINDETETEIEQG